MVGPLGRAAAIHREGQGWTARLDKRRLDAAAAAAGGLRGGGVGRRRPPALSKRGSLVVWVPSLMSSLMAASQC